MSRSDRIATVVRIRRCHIAFAHSIGESRHGIRQHSQPVLGRLAAVFGFGIVGLHLVQPGHHVFRKLADRPGVGACTFFAGETDPRDR